MANSPPYDVVFDFDGVLGDSAPLIVEILGDVLHRELGLSVGEGELRAMVGPPLHHAVPTLLATSGITVAPSDIDDVIARFRREYAVRAPTETPMFPDIEEAVAALFKSTRLSICSSKPRPLVEAILNEWDASDWFADIEAPEPHVSEPKASGLRRLLVRLGAKPESTALVGDTIFDAEAASDRGIAFIAAAWGIGSPDDLAAAGAKAVAAQARDLPDLIEALRG